MEQQIDEKNSPDLRDMQMIEKALRFSAGYQDFTGIGQDKCTFMLQKVIQSIRQIYESDNILECMQAYLHDTEQNSDELRGKILQKAYIGMDWNAVNREMGESPGYIQKKQFIFFFLLLLETMTEGEDKEMDYMRKVPMPSYGEYLGYGDLLLVRVKDINKDNVMHVEPLQSKMMVSQWFDNYVEINTLEELLQWNFAARTTLASMLRYPYNYHLWIPLTQLAKAKRLGFGWQNVLKFRNLPEDCFYVNPTNMSVGIYGDENSEEFQKDLINCFCADNIKTFITAMNMMTEKFYPKYYDIPVPSGLKGLIKQAKLI